MTYITRKAVKRVAQYQVNPQSGDLSRRVQLYKNARLCDDGYVLELEEGYNQIKEQHFYC